MLLEWLSGRPSDTNVLIGRIIMVIVGLIIGIWWGTNPQSFWKYFKYVLLFWIILNIVSYFQDREEERKKK